MVVGVAVATVVMMIEMALFILRALQTEG